MPIFFIPKSKIVFKYLLNNLKEANLVKYNFFYYKFFFFLKKGNQLVEDDGNETTRLNRVWSHERELNSQRTEEDAYVAPLIFSFLF